MVAAGNWTINEAMVKDWRKSDRPILSCTLSNRQTGTIDRCIEAADRRIEALD